MHPDSQPDEPAKGRGERARRLGGLFCVGIADVLLVLLFYAVVTPVALVMKAVGKDALRLKRDPAARSYWIFRVPPGPAPETMNRQF